MFPQPLEVCVEAPCFGFAVCAVVEGLCWGGGIFFSEGSCDSVLVPPRCQLWDPWQEPCALGTSSSWKKRTVNTFLRSMVSEAHLPRSWEKEFRCAGHF